MSATAIRPPAAPVVGYAPDPEAGPRPTHWYHCAACSALYGAVSEWDELLADRWEPLCRPCVAAYLPVLAAFVAGWLDLRRILCRATGPVLPSSGGGGR